ncbi:hypothetical protein P43SY_004797 [Pythium insidiosum]|uniref:GOLD domain-containing protein n=1 Tax=Pythium insidiosum TaxID=114742 RepID=A0AAD5M9B6_PYTIN|nr:hypothetical protein P43SY_004797 [Pythium insidiosum]
MDPSSNRNGFTNALETVARENTRVQTRTEQRALSPPTLAIAKLSSTNTPSNHRSGRMIYAPSRDEKADMQTYPLSHSTRSHRALAVTTPVCLALWIALAAVALSSVKGSSFTFSLPSRLEECFIEEVDARTSDNKLLFRFGILEPELYDFMDVTIKSPTWKIVESWNRTQSNHVTAPVRESGLYHLCFKKRAGSSRDFMVYYSFDFISTGSLHVVLYPNLAATVDKATPDSSVYTSMQLMTEKGVSKRVGVIDFSLSGVSSSVLRSNTRVQLLLTVEYVSQTKVDIAIAKYPHKVDYPLSWDSLGNYAKSEYRQYVFDNAVAELGSHLTFDVTEMVDDALNKGKSTITFTIHANEDAQATIMGMSYTTPDYYPQLAIEDMGLDLMREVAYFKEKVFTLRGEIAYIKQKERGSRNAAESTNTRVKWLSLLTNLVLVWIAFGQVLYIRSMLENSY